MNKSSSLFYFAVVFSSVIFSGSCLPTYNSAASDSTTGLLEDNNNSDNSENMDDLYYNLARTYHHSAVKRRYDPLDPKSLFANIYGNYGNYVGKRMNLPSQMETANHLYYGPPLALQSRKRGLGDRYDPRNLFRAIYGYKK